MTLEELEALADKAIARWNDPDKPLLPGAPNIKICTRSPKQRILPGVTQRRIGVNRDGLTVLLLDAESVKQGISLLRQEFLVKEGDRA